MAENNKTFILVGKFDDQITPALKRINRTINAFDRKLNKGIASTFKAMNAEARDFAKEIGRLEKVFEGRSMRGVKRISDSLNDAARAAGKVRDTVSQIGEGVKGFDSMAESMSGVARVASRAQEEVLGIGEAASRANRQADDLMTTLLKAEGLSRFGDAMAQGFSRGVGMIQNVAAKGGGVVGKAFTDAMQDELADIKAASGIQGSFGLAGFKGDFSESQKMYKKYDQVVSEMIRQSSAPTAKVVELQRYTLDTMGPLMLAAEGVKKGTAMKDIDPKKIESSAQNYGRFLEKVALFSQGTGSAGFRVAAGIEQLVTRGKIDTTIDFFTDNIMLMKNLEAAGFAGRGAKSAKMMSATDAERMRAMMEAFNKSMSSESTAAMAQSLTGSLQGLQDTLFNPSVGILGMAVTFTKKEQKAANASIKKIMDARIEGYKKELKNVNISEKRREELNNNIAQATATRDKLLKEDTISTPFKAFSYAFTNLIQGLTNAINAIGPVWTSLSIAMIEVTNKVFAPLTETLQNVASDMRGGKYTQMEGFGRIIGEIFKTIGQIFADLAKMISDPNSAMGKAQSEFMKGFMDAFKEPGSLEKAKKGLSDGINALVKKIFDTLLSIVTSDTMRPLVLPALALMFGPPLISAVIAGATPLMINAIGKIFAGLAARAGVVNGGGGGGRAGAALDMASMADGFLPGGRRGARARARNIARIRAQRRGGAYAKSLLPGGSQYSAPIGPIPAGFQRPGGRTIMPANVSKMAKAMTGIQKFGLAAGKVAKGIPGLSVAIGVLDFTARKAAGQSTLQAGGGAIGAGIGGVAGGVLGSALGPAGTVAGGMLGSFLGDWLGSNIGKALQSVGPALSGAMSGLTDWFKNLPYSLGFALGQAKTQLQTAWQGFVNWWNGLGPWAATMVARAMATLRGQLAMFGRFISQAFTGQINWGALAKQLAGQIGNMVKGAIGWIKGVWADFTKGFRAGEVAGKNQNPKAKAKGEPGVSFGSLGEAVRYEMQNKPPGSDLVIANSSETIIPAAEGLGSMKGVIDAIWQSARSTANSISTGFSVLTNTVKTTQERSVQVTRLSAAQTTAAINRSMQVSMAGDRQILTAIKAAAAAKGFFGGGGGGGALGGGSGSLSAASQLASSMGLMTTSGFRPGDPGYHGANRARDFSNSTGPTPQMMAFAQRMASTFGSSITELIYTPLGYSIKNGRKVPPIAAGSHYNHVHVAFGRGPGQPTLFSSANAAAAYERMMAPAGARVASVTANSSEFGGGNTYNVNPTINISGYNQDPETLARIVWQHTFEEIQRMRSMRTT